MPEMKHNFTGGKMNKDLDERLIPGNEYKDALNIQVSTSEGSDVGTVQNILGNSQQSNMFDGGFCGNERCVGTVSDEKDNAVYWFVTQEGSNTPNPVYHHKDTIIRYKDETPEVVFVDIHRVDIDAVVGGIYTVGCDQQNCQNVGWSVISFLGNMHDAVQVGMTVTRSDGGFLGIVKLVNAGQIHLEEPTPIPLIHNYITCSRPRVLNFNPNEIITGINIVDDMLFWTDGFDEPKKINIKRSIEGTNGTINQNTRLINHTRNVTLNTNITNVLKEHITVVKKSPSTAPTLKMHDGRREGIISGTITDLDFSNKFAGDSMNLTIDKFNADITPAFNWKKGDILLLKGYDNGTSSPVFPLFDFHVKVVIDTISVSGASQTYCAVKAKIISKSVNPEDSTFTASPNADFQVDLLDETKKLFELKFPRFAYRYKYLDGEYSSFSPWSEIAFLPTTFNYHPKEGFNLGMANTITKLEIGDFVPRFGENLDVVEVDILYKESNSPNVYIVDTISKDDQQTVSSIDFNGKKNHWETKTYEITSESIYSTLPSNQLLRVWDNVPKKALAQEITANRLIYGNYTQGYDLTPNSEIYKPEFDVMLNAFVGSNGAVIDTIAREPGKSIKTLREYQLGVVFQDEFGRETPILTNESATIKVSKNHAKSRNQLRTRLMSSPPDFAKSFTFYVKETSTEYYNLAMDRWYDAEDGNIWLSFPSSDRNKVDIDDYLILKKGVDSDELISEAAKYKVLAIENEAPDFIKKTILPIGEKSNASGNLLDDATSYPVSTVKEFRIDYPTVKDSGLGRLHEHFLSEGDLHVKFKYNNLFTPEYRITAINSDANALASGYYQIQVEKVFGSAVDFIFDGSGTPHFGTTVHFINHVEENKPQFDGRFFVKVYNDITTEENLNITNSTTPDSWKVLAERKIFLMSGFFAKGDRTNDIDPGDEYHNAVDPGFYADAILSNTSNVSGKIGDRYAACYNDNAASEKWDCGEINASGIWEGFANTGGDGWGTHIDKKNPSPSTWYKYNAYFRGPTDNATIIQQIYSGTGLSSWVATPNPTPSGGDLAIKGGFNNKAEFDRFGVETIETRRSNGDMSGFCDIWFIDAAHYSALYDSDGYPVAWNPPNPGQGIDTVTSANHHWIDISFGALRPNKAADDYTHNQDGAIVDGHNGTQTLYDDGNILTNTGVNSIFKVGDSANEYYEDEKDFVNGISAGGKYIRWKEDPNNDDPVNIYEILDSEYFYVVRFDDRVPAKAGAGEEHKAYDVRPGYGSSVVGLNANNYYAGGGFTELWDGYNSGQWDNWGAGGLANDGGMIVATWGRPENFQIKWRLKLDKPIKWNPLVADASNVDGPDAVTNNGVMNGLSPNTNQATNGAGGTFGDAVGYTLQVVAPEWGEVKMPTDPAIWETEPKRDEDIDIYYEASNNIPIELNNETNYQFAPAGSVITVDIRATNGSNAASSSNLGPITVVSWDNDVVTFSDYIMKNEWPVQPPTQQDEIWRIDVGTVFYFTRPDGSYTTALFKEWIEPGLLPVDPPWFTDGGYLQARFFTDVNVRDVGLGWSNCYSFANGVESDRVRDSFNAVTIGNGVKASTTLDKKYKEEHRKYGLIYSGIYNSTSGINNLNQFIAAENITKDINPTYGSIQKLHTRNANLITLCEDKVLSILANRDALYNADGNSQLIATNRVLGSTQPFAGEFGISTNPESFASYGYRAYFADKQRGAVLRLSKDGLTPISDYGMKDWFADNLKLNQKLIGSYDSRKDDYNLTLIDYNNGYSFIPNADPEIN